MIPVELMSRPYELLSPSDENPWMLDAAKDWIAETKGEPGKHNTGINIYKWSTDYPEAAFGVIQTILKSTLNNLQTKLDYFGSK